MTRRGYLYNWQDRLRAMGIHAIASVVLAMLALIVVYRIWYPSPLDVAVGVTHIFLLMLAVDAVIGPLLTFAVFDRAKPSLKADLSIIVVLQLAAFAYGMHTVAQGRPVWLVFNVDRFDVVRAHEVDLRDAEQVRPEFRSSSWRGPRWVAARLPQDAKENARLLEEALSGGSDLPQRPKYYVPLDEMRAELVARSKPVAELFKWNKREDVNRSAAGTDTRWVPLMSNDQPMAVLLNGQGEDLKVVPLRPW